MTFDEWFKEFTYENRKWLQVDPNELEFTAKCAWSAAFSEAGRVAVETIAQHPLPDLESRLAGLSHLATCPQGNKPIIDSHLCGCGKRTS